LNNISITKDGAPVNWTLQTIPAVIDQTSQINVICTTNEFTGELGYGQYVVVTYIYEEVKTLSIKIKMPAIFSRFAIIYQEDFSYGLSANWKHKLFMVHSSLGKHNIEDWIIMEENGNNFLHCLNKDCQLLILEDPLNDFYDINITYDLLTNDDNANGVIFRYDASGEYDKFYIVWYTTNHPSPVNGPHIDEINYFDWNITSDQIEPDKITVHYVEQDANGWNWYRLADVNWIREENKWYTWRIITNGTNMALFIDNEEFPTLEWNDMRISHGFIGLISFFNIDLYYDNIYAWTTDI